MVSETQEQGFDQWAVVELMGHRRLAGKVTEQQMAGIMFIRLDVPMLNGDMFTQFYGPSSVYCLTPVPEEVARSVALHNQPQPVHQWELPARTGIGAEDEPF